MKQSISEGESRFQEELARCGPTGFADTVEELKGWAAFSDDAESDSASSEFEGDEPIDVWEDPTLPPQEWGATIRRTEPRVGRNDPCPCGSGRKYKKCCGSA